MLFALLLAATATIAQDLVQVVPNNAKVEYEDARVRVVRLKIAPNEKLPTHDRPPRVVIALTANNVRLTTPDGQEHTVQVPAGNIGWSGPGKRSVTNLDAPLENVIVEMKNYGEPPKAVPQPPSKADPRALVDRYHQWVFENQYVRVYNVRVPAGATTDFHTHGYDSVFVQLTPESSVQQVQGQEWGAPEKSPSGQVSYSADTSEPRTHRVRNVGDQEFRVVIVQLMR